MKLPKKIACGYLTFPVKVLPQEKLDEMAPGPYSVFGLFSGKDGIHLAKEQNNGHMAHSFLHEILHAACYYRETFRDARGNEYQELFVTEIANGLATMIKQNPKVFLDLIKAIK